MSDYNEDDNQQEQEEEQEQEEQEEEYEYNENDENEYEYEYEDEDNLAEYNLPKMLREISESHFNIPEGTYTLHNYTDIAPLMEKLVLEVSNLLGVQNNVAELLLRFVKWNKGVLAERYYNDPKKLLVLAGIELDDDLNTQVNPNNGLCLICYDTLPPGTGHSLNCKHEFCRDCYSGYLENLVSDGPSCITMSCPSFKCPLKISSDTLKSICPKEVYDKYYMYIVRDFIDSSSFMHWCPAPNCGKIAIGTELTEIVCKCSFPTCAECGLESHRPATCKEVSKWILKNTNESENSSWILVNTKGCPKCSRRIEKNQGCNHMTCSMCRHEFCWICLGNWIGHNGNSYQCNQYLENSADTNELRNVKQRLDRYLHYFSRFHSHDQSLKYAIKQKDEVRKLYETSELNEVVGLDLILKAIELVISCRRALKNSYIVGYYDLHSKIASDLYEMQQQMLESNTETLSGLTEKKEFTVDDRDHITNLTTVTVKFLEFMLKYHHDSKDDEN